MNAAPILTPRTQQALECRSKSVYLCPTPTAPRFVVRQSRASRDFTVAFACAVAWALLWVLLLYAAFSPRADVRPGEADLCGGAMIEIDGRCVLGEDLEVQPPLGWSRQ